MNKSGSHHFEGHLAIREFSVRAGEEWVTPPSGWTIIQIGKGPGYCLQPQRNQELETGSVLLTTGAVKTSIRASQLVDLSFHGFSIVPARLMGITTLIEQTILEAAAAGKETATIFPPDSPTAVKMQELHAGQEQNSLRFRLKLLQFFVELIAPELKQAAPISAPTDARQRLQAFLAETPSSKLVEMNFSELAQQTRCTSRHLGRIFQELVGMSFGDKRTAIRMEKARELLATTDSKIVDVALESGFKSLSLFNLVFARHFGISPGKWRQRQATAGESTGKKKLKYSPPGNRQLISLRIKTFTLPSQNNVKNARKPVRKRPGATALSPSARRFQLFSKPA